MGRSPRVRPASPIPAWALFCFVLSGAAGLLFEVVWSKQVSYLLGSSLHSVATVTAAFLGGLALGARFLGTRLARGADPGRAYAWLEVGVALSGAAVLPVLRLLDGPVGIVYRAAGGEGVPFTLARLGILFVVLVPPALLMGATLPVLVARIERGGIGAGLAWLYALNTVGAVLGSLGAGFVLMPRWGLTATTAVAAGLDLAAAALAFAWSGRASERGAERGSAASVPVALLPREARAVVALAFAASGFAALALQLAWVRLYGLVLGSSVYSFAGVLGVYLAGLALGSMLVAPWLARVRGTAAFALLQLALAASALAGLLRVPALPRAMLDLGERLGGSWSGLLVNQLALVVPVVAIPCVILGALFPLAARLLQHDEGGPATGAAYALNTLGTLSGALLTGWLLLPAFGVTGVIAIAAALATIAGLVSLAPPRMPRARPAVLVAAAVLCAAIAAGGMLRPAWDPVLMSLGTYRPFHARNLLASFRAAGGVGDPTRELAAVQRVLYYRDGINASVLVSTDSEGRRRWLRVGGKIDAGSGDMLTQVMLGVLPTAMAEPGARTLIVGLGSGYTVRAALDLGAGPTEVVELEPAVVAGSHFFHERATDPLFDPRVTLHVEDARTRLAHGGGHYGLIISEPTNPWIAGVNNLFTRDFYRLVRARLSPGGVFAQWIQLYELSPDTFRSMLAAFMAEFPEAQLFCLWDAYDVILVSAPPGATLDLARLRSPAGLAAIARARLSAPAEVAGFLAASAARLRALAAGAPENTDDRPYVEYRAPRDLIEVGRGAADRPPAVLAEFSRALLPSPAGALAGWPADSVLLWRARARLRAADDARAAAVLAELEHAGGAALVPVLRAEHELDQRRARAEAAYTSATARLAAGDQPGARDAFETWIREGGASSEGWLDLARLRRSAGEPVSAAAAARRAIATASGELRLEGLLLLGSCEHEARHPEAALAAFREAQAASPADPRAYDREARLWFERRDPSAARAAVERGLAAVPGDATLLEARRALAQWNPSRR